VAFNGIVRRSLENDAGDWRRAVYVCEHDEDHVGEPDNSVRPRGDTTGSAARVRGRHLLKCRSGMRNAQV
jgi:hypothetical protein